MNNCANTFAGKVNTYAEIEYIRNEYIKQGVMNKDGTKTHVGQIDYCIYPWEMWHMYGHVQHIFRKRNKYNTCTTCVMWLFMVQLV
jgi:hypothetical protein